MPIIGQIFDTIILFPIRNILVGFYKLYLLLHIPGAYGFAIISLVILVRFVLHPFFKQQLETSKKMQQLKPQLDKLTAKYKNEPKKLQAEQMRLYQEAGINPAAGCLFMLVQIPIFIGLYSTLTAFLKSSGHVFIDEINKTLYFPFLKISSLDPHFFGINLALSPQKSGLWFYYFIPIITGILQYFQAKTSMPQTSNVPEKNGKKDFGLMNSRQNDKEDTKSNAAGDFQNAMNTQMKYILPVMIAWFSYTLPVGLSLYWNIFSIFSIIQYRLVHKKVGDEKLSEIEEKELAKITAPKKKAKK